MLITLSQLHNIAKTIYYLMTGMYNLNYFKSPYNNLIPDEFSSNSGKAIAVFSYIYDEITELNDLLNKSTAQETEYELFEDLKYCIEELQEEICVNATILGYFIAKKYTDLSIEQIPRKIFFRNEFIDLSRCNKLSKLIGQIELLITHLLNEKTEGVSILQNVQKAIETEFLILSNIAYSHGIAIGKGEYPLWFNPEFNDQNIIENIFYQGTPFDLTIALNIFCKDNS